MPLFLNDRQKVKLSPVATVNDKLTKTEQSAIQSLLCGTNDMFGRAKTISNLMKIEKLTVSETAKVLSMSAKSVSEKLRLLEFTQSERKMINDAGLCERTAYCFLGLDKLSRFSALCYCTQNKLTCEECEKYVSEIMEQKSLSEKCRENIHNGIKKTVIRDIGLFFNTIDHAVELVKNSGYDIEKQQKDDGEYVSLAIKVKKNRKN